MNKSRHHGFARVSRWMRHSWIAALALIVTPQAHAETTTTPEYFLTQMRAALARYDLGPEGTVKVLRALATQIASGSAGELAVEAKFLRAAAASDLLFVAEFQNDEGLKERLAAALDTTPAELRPTLSAALEGSAHGMYRDVALASLAALRSTPVFDVKKVEAAAQTRSDAEFLRHEVTQLRTPETALTALAQDGYDPCEHGRDSCPAIYRGYGVEARRAMRTLQATAAARARLARSVKEGDPLANALGETLAALSKELDAPRLRPMPLLTAPLVASDAQRKAQNAPALLVMLSTQGADYAWLPGIGVDDKGALMAACDKEPCWPQKAELPGASTHYNYPRPITALTAMLKSIGPSITQSAPVGVATVAGVSAQEFLRLMLSLRGAGATSALLLAAASGDDTPSIVIQPITEEEAKSSRPAGPRIRVRMGGYSVNAGRGNEDIPRVLDDKGIYRFDVPSLRERLRKEDPKTASLSFAADVGLENMWPATFYLAPKQSPLVVVLP